MLDKRSITGPNGLADEPLLSSEDPETRYQSLRAVARRTPRLEQIILLSAGAKATNAVLQITADGVKIKPFIFIRLSIARNNI